MNTFADPGMTPSYNSIVSPAISDTAALVGRILLAVLFIKSGWGKIGGFDATASMMASKGLPMASVLLVITIAMELGGSLLLVVGYKARWAALAFALWLIPVTLTFHAYWNVPPEQVQAQSINFFKNLSIFGGMLMVFAMGPGRYSVDKR
jgi:putative oxidoreductase